MKIKLQKGFTLIELMVVVAIIGILSSIALPAYQDYIARSQMTEALVLMNTQKNTIIEISSNDGAFTNADNGSQGIPVALDLAGKYTASVAITDGVMTATMSAAGTVSAGIAAGNLTMTPTLNASGIIDWDCGAAGDVANKYRPKSCR